MRVHFISIFWPVQTSLLSVEEALLPSWHLAASPSSFVSFLISFLFYIYFLKSSYSSFVRYFSGHFARLQTVDSRSHQNTEPISMFLLRPSTGFCFIQHNSTVFTYKFIPFFCFQDPVPGLRRICWSLCSKQIAVMLPSTRTVLIFSILNQSIQLRHKFTVPVLDDAPMVLVLLFSNFHILCPS
jgi:hypothetical protein